MSSAIAVSGSPARYESIGIGPEIGSRTSASITTSCWKATTEYRWQAAIAMPLNVRLSPPEFVAILNHAAARLVFYESDFAPLIEQLRSSCPSIERFVELGDPYEQLLAAATPERVDIMQIDENTIAELFYTSGSTGTPKGVMLSHRTLYLHALSVATCYRRS